MQTRLSRRSAFVGAISSVPSLTVRPSSRRKSKAVEGSSSDTSSRGLAPPREPLVYVAASVNNVAFAHCDVGGFRKSSIKPLESMILFMEKENLGVLVCRQIGMKREEFVQKFERKSFTVVTSMTGMASKHGGQPGSIGTVSITQISISILEHDTEGHTYVIEVTGESWKLRVLSTHFPSMFKGASESKEAWSLIAAKFEEYSKIDSHIPIILMGNYGARIGKWIQQKGGISKDVSNIGSTCNLVNLLKNIDYLPAHAWGEGAEITYYNSNLDQASTVDFICLPAGIVQSFRPLCYQSFHN